MSAPAAAAGGASSAPPVEVSFEFRVGEPQQRQGSGALDRMYWVYQIKWRTNSSALTIKEGQIIRRYSHFEWLRKELSNAFPYLIIPPIPGKDIGGTVEKFVQTSHNPQLLEYRSRALRKFLSRVGAHPGLQHCKTFTAFLTLNEDQWELEMRSPAAPPAPQGTSAVAGAIAGASAAVWGTAVPAAGQQYAVALSDSAIAALPSNPQLWEEVKLYVTQLEESIRTLKDRLDTLAKRRRATGSSLTEFSRAFGSVGEMERSLEQSDTPLSSAIQAVGRHSGDLALVYVEHADQETKQVVETLMYYSGMCQSVKETLGHVTGILSLRDSQSAKAKTLMQNRDKLVAKGGKPDQVAKAEKEAVEANDKLQVLNIEAASAEQKFREELKRFHREKQYDMKAMLKLFVELQMDYAQKMRRQWESVLPAVEAVRL